MVKKTCCQIRAVCDIFSSSKSKRSLQWKVVLIEKGHCQLWTKTTKIRSTCSDWNKFVRFFLLCRVFCSFFVRWIMNETDFRWKSVKPLITKAGAGAGRLSSSKKIRRHCFNSWHLFACCNAGSGCGTAVEDTPHNREVVGPNPARSRAFSLFSLLNNAPLIQVHRWGAALLIFF